MKTLNIISRYNENIDWVNNLDGDIVIYNKGDDFQSDYVKYNIENIGTETETFARAITEYYFNLDYYDYVCFLQGHPFDHCPDLFEKIKQNSNSYIYLSKYSGTNINFESKNQNFYIFNKHIALFEKLIDMQKSKITFSRINPVTNELYECSDEFFDTMFVLDFIGIPYKNRNLISEHGAQFKVNTSMLKSKSHDWWVELHNFICYCWVYLGWEKIGNVMERIWPFIWEFEYKL